MMIEVTKKMHKERLKKLIEFTKENQSLMWNYMLTIEQIRKEPEDELLMKKLKKQADDYQKSIKLNKK